MVAGLVRHCPARSEENNGSLVPQDAGLGNVDAAFSGFSAESSPHAVSTKKIPLIRTRFEAYRGIAVIAMRRGIVNSF
jgi:hypothetical protein